MLVTHSIAKKPAAAPRPSAASFEEAPHHGSAPLVLTAIFGVAASTLHILGQSFSKQAPLLFGCSAVLLYFATLFLPYRYALFTIAMFLLGFLFPIAEPSTFVRIGIIALAFAGITRARPAVPPFINLYSLWFLFLVITVTLRAFQLPWIANQLLLPRTPELIIQILTENVGVLILGLLLFSRRAHTLCGKTFSAPSFRLYFVHVIALTAIVSIWIVGASLLYSRGSAFSAGFSLFLEHQPAASIITCGIILLPIIIGQLIAHNTEEIVAVLTHASEETPHHYITHRTIPFGEVRSAYRVIQDNLHRQLTRIREGEEATRALRIEMRDQDNESEELNLALRTLARLIETSPWGIICCTPNGSISTMNEEAARLLDVKRDKVLGQHISALDGEHPWQKSVFALLAEGCRSLHRSQVLESRRQISPAINRYYLELVLRAHMAPPIESKNSGEYVTSETAVMLFIRHVPDLRDFILNLLIPTGLEVIGCQAAEFSKLIRNQLGAIVGSTSIVSGIIERLQDSSGTSFAQTPTGSEIFRALQNVDEIARSSVGDLKEFEAKQTPTADNSARVNITRSLEHTLRYFQDLLSPDQSARIQFSGTQLAADNPSAPATSETPSGDIYLQISESELTKFYAYLLALVKNIMPKTPEISISLGHETVHDEMLHILPGSHPGKYVRFIIRHSGQSLTANMMTGKFHRLNSGGGQYGDAEQSLSLLQLQTSRLGGFLSVQSTASKGTAITLYLPETRAAAAQPHQRPEKSQKHFVRRGFNESSIESNHILLVGTDDNTLATLDQMLRHLGYDVHIQHTTLLIDEINAPLEFMGSGFNPAREDQGESLRASVPPQCQTVVVNIENATKEVVNLIRQLEKQYPDAGFLLVIDPSEQLRILFSDWATLTRPFDVSELAQAIKNALIRL